MTTNSLGASEICISGLCVSGLCVSRLCVSGLCVSRLCVSGLCGLAAGWVSSTRTTVSAPCTITAPVRIRAASAAPTVQSAGWPAEDTPTTRNVTGRFVTSAARTA
ncbi:unannotated protein [freshwater metagenome]|uniref:Unannotated protein n=1 Tax=freshwater metagenome TaxID=449393 RepID=A0A6J6ZMY4_9ZZZZ